MSERDTPPRNEKDDAKPAAALTDVKIGRRGLSGTPKTEAHTATAGTGRPGALTSHTRGRVTAAIFPGCSSDNTFTRAQPRTGDHRE